MLYVVIDNSGGLFIDNYLLISWASEGGGPSAQAWPPGEARSRERSKGLRVHQGEPLVQHYLSNTCVLQKWRVMQQIQLAVLDVK